MFSISKFLKELYSWCCVIRIDRFAVINISFSVQLVELNTLTLYLLHPVRNAYNKNELEGSARQVSWLTFHDRVLTRSSYVTSHQVM